MEGIVKGALLWYYNLALISLKGYLSCLPAPQVKEILESPQYFAT